MHPTNCLRSCKLLLILLFSIISHTIINAQSVGVLEGSPGVSLDGSSSYTVPLKLPSGVAGLQPDLSLVYNSRSSDGLAGWGWNLSGLSNITRGSTTAYHNGIVRPLKMNADDNFYLDGQLLMPISGTNGGDGTEYKLESENYSKIQSYGGYNGDPVWWKVTNKDGSVVEYGNSSTEEDKLKAGATMVWFVRTMKDVNDNPITYNYYNYNNEAVIASIQYANATIEFEYTYKENSNVTFVNGTAFANTKLLNNVVVKVDNVRQISYRLTHSPKIKRHYLQTIELVGTDNSSTWATNFNYGYPDYEETVSLLSGYYQNSYPNVTLSPGDYDGDGKTDLVVAERRGNVNGDGTGIESTTSGGYHVITNVGDRPFGFLDPSHYEMTQTYTPITYMKADEFTNPYSYYATDYRGEGKDGLLRPSKIWHQYQDSRGDWHDDQMNYTDAIYLEDFNKNGSSLSVNSNNISTPFSYSTWSTYNFYLKESNSFIQGDFDGDSKVDVISILGSKYQSGEIIERKFNIFSGWYIYRRTPVWDYNYKGFLTNTSNGYYHSEIIGIDNAFKDAQAIFPVDFDGDGKQELLVFKKYNYLIYAINQLPASTGYSFQAVQIYSGYNISYASYKRVLAGDFNGDRKTDIIGIGTSQYAAIWYSTGTSYAQGSFQLDRTPDFSTVWFDFFTTGDFNGDGITDLFHYYSTNNMQKQSVHYFKGMNYTPSTTSTGYAYYCANEWIPYDNYTIIQTYYQSCQDPYDGWWYDAYLIEYTYTSPEYVTPLYTKGAGYNYGMVANMVYGTPPETGDFNGDGKTEIIQSTGYGNYVLLDAFGGDKNSSLLQSVTDGLGNTTTFNYKTLAEKTTTNVYSNTGNVSLYFPLNVMPLAMKVVTQMTQPNGVGGTDNSVFRYQDAIMDRHKGFLGFRRNTTVRNGEVQERNESEINTTYRALIPQKHTTLYKDDAGTYEDLLSSVTTNTTIVPLSISTTRYYWFNRYKLQTASTIEANELAGSAIKKEITYDAYDNVTQEIVKKGYLSGGDVVPVETVTTNATYVQTGKALVPMFPTRAETISSRNGNTNTRVTTSTYTPDKGSLASQTNWAETPLASTVSFTYNSNGNLTQTVTATGSKPPVTTTSTYDVNQRYLVTSTVTCDNVTRTSSLTRHPMWGEILTKTDGDGSTGSLTTTYEYDALGKLKKTITPLGHEILESDVWDVSGQQSYYHFTDHQDYRGADQKIWYDRLGRVIRTQTLGWNNQWITQTKTYDSRGRESTSSSPYYSGDQVLINTNNYDRLFRLSTIVTPSGTNTLTYSYPGSGQIVVTEVNGAGQTSTKKTDAAGRVIETTDHGGSVTHTYDALGNVLTTALNGATVVTNTYDGYGRKTQSVDVNAGTVSYAYDESDNIISVTDANNKVSTMTYDGLNRLLSRNTVEGSTNYEYYNTANNKALKKVYNSNHSRELVYDSYRRTVLQTDIVAGEGTFNTSFEFDANSNPSATVYPNGTRVESQYNNAGLLSKVLNGGYVLYEALAYDGQGHSTQYKLVNGQTSTDTYNNGLPTRFYTPGIQDLNFNFEQSSGNLLSRTDAIKGLTETFTYDNLNRLLSASVNNVLQFGITYDGSPSQSKGNIAVKSDVGTYTYLDRKPNAVGYISPLINTAMAAEATSVSYTSFQRPLQINKGANRLDLVYGTDDERIRTVRYLNGGVAETKVFLGDFERQNINGGTNDIVYVAGGNGFCALIVNGVPYATYSDYLGNILTISNSSGAVVAQQNFDAWGRRRNVNDWTYVNVGENLLPVWLYRGFTGHEHLVEFALINMNARLYDPYNGRMLSPDNATNELWGTQGYNKYSYANNNPLKYIDPTGDDPIIVALIIGFVMGAYTGGVAANAGQMNPFKWDFQNGKTWGYMIGGGIIGGLSGAMGASITSSINAAGGIMANTVGAMASSFMFSTGMSALTGGMMSPSISFGIASYDFGTNSWGYLGKKGNKWYTTLSYTFGALANLQDLVTGFWGKNYEYQYETSKGGKVGHGNIREVVPGAAKNPVKISVANVNSLTDGTETKLGAAIKWLWKAAFTKKAGGGEFWSEAGPNGVPEAGWVRIPLRLNSKIIEWMNKNITAGKDLWGIGKLRFGIGFGCVTYAARALWTSGIPTIPIINWFGPRILWIQLAIRHAGIIASPITNSLPK